MDTPNAIYPRSLLLAWVPVAAYLLLSYPRYVELTPACEAKGTLNQIRASVQGAAYAKTQLRTLNSEIEGWLQMPSRMAHDDSIIATQMGRVNRLVDSTDRYLDSVFQAHPGLGSRPKSREATELRREAGAIKSAETRAKIQQVGQERVAMLTTCRHAIVQRVQEPSLTSRNGGIVHRALGAIIFLALAFGPVVQSKRAGVNSRWLRDQADADAWGYGYMLGVVWVSLLVVWSPFAASVSILIAIVASYFLFMSVPFVVPGQMFARIRGARLDRYATNLYLKGFVIGIVVVAAILEL